MLEELSVVIFIVSWGVVDIVQRMGMQRVLKHWELPGKESGDSKGRKAEAEYFHSNSSLYASEY